MWFNNVRHRLGLTTRTQISVCKSPFPSAGTAVSLLRAKTVQQRPLLPREVETWLRLPPQSVAEISRHSVLSEDRIRQCGTSSGSRHKVSVCKSPFPSAGTAVSLFGAKMVQQRPLLPREVETRLLDCGVTLGENWPPEPTSSYVSIDFWCQLVANLATTAF